jgi:hypothetical protein
VLQNGSAVGDLRGEQVTEADLMAALSSSEGES